MFSIGLFLARARRQRQIVSAECSTRGRKTPLNRLPRAKPLRRHVRIVGIDELQESRHLEDVAPFEANAVRRRALHVGEVSISAGMYFYLHLPVEILDDSTASYTGYGVGTSQSFYIDPSLPQDFTLSSRLQVTGR